MVEKTSISVRKIFRGALLILAGFLGGGVLTLSLQVLLARFLQPDLYGVFSQGMAVLYTLVMISLLGLNAGISRQISFEERDGQKAAEAVGSSLLLVIPFSLLAFASLFLTAEVIALELFGDQRMVQVLKIFSLAGPAMAVNSIFISGFRGYQRSRERVILLDFLIPFLQILLVGTLIMMGYQIGGAVAGYASAFLIATGVISYWYLKRYSLSYSRETLEKLVRLSWPLMVSAVSVQVFLWTPPILTGILSSSRDSGLLNTALPLASSTKMFLSSAAFLYLPVVSELIGSERSGRIPEVHSSITKWITYLSVPLLGFFLIYSSESISLIFGESYTAAGTALLVMAVGYLTNSMTGPLGELLIAAGKTRREMSANIVKLAIFLSCSYILIPQFGFLGAAAAYSAGMICGDLIRLWFARDLTGFFYKLDYLKPFIALFVAFLASTATSQIIPKIILWSAVYTAVLALLKPLNRIDREMISDSAGLNRLESGRPLRVLDFLTHIDE